MCGRQQGRHDGAVSTAVFTSRVLAAEWLAQIDEKPGERRVNDLPLDAVARR
jgi:hypothetical protein